MKIMKKFRYILFPVLTCLILYIIMRESSLTQIIACLKSCRISAILLAGGSMAVFVLCEAMNLRRCLNLTAGGQLATEPSGAVEDKSRHISLRRQALPYALTGFFFSGITPFASGGQPMQLYCMRKDGISAARGAVSLAMELASFQAAAVTLAAFGLLCFHDFIIQGAGFAAVFLLMGFAVNLGLLALLLCAILSPRSLAALGNLIAGFVQMLWASKAGSFRRAVEKWTEDYQSCISCLRRAPGEAARLFLTSLLQLAAMHSVPYWVALSLGINKANFLQMFSMQAVFFLLVSVIPLPGGGGAGEGGFLLIFAAVFTGSYLESAMLLSRFASFYLPMLISGAFMWKQNLLKQK